MVQPVIVLFWFAKIHNIVGKLLPPHFNISLTLYGQKSVATVGADEEDATGALLEYEIQEGAGSVELGFFI